MRSKEKVNLNGQLKPETMEKLKSISEDKNLSLIKTVEYLIDNYQKQAEPVKLQSRSPTVKLTVKPLAPRFNLAAEMERLRNEKS